MKIFLAIGVLAFVSRTSVAKVLTDCGGTINGGSGEIVGAEVYQFEESQWMSCRWIFREPEGKAVFINFDDFEIKGRDCVDLNYYESYALHETVCNDDGPKRFVSRGDVVLAFTSYGTSEEPYVFKASYSTVDDNDIFEISDDAPSGIIDIEPGYFTANKRYTIRAPEGQHVRLSIDQYFCKDNSTISVEEDNVVLLHEDCSRADQDTVYTSTGNELDIVFYSDNDESYFKASYESFETVVG